MLHGMMHCGACMHPSIEKFNMRAQWIVSIYLKPSCRVFMDAYVMHGARYNPRLLCNAVLCVRAVYRF